MNNTERKFDIGSTIILFAILVGGIALPFACTGCDTLSIDPNQKALSELEGLAVVHAEEAQALKSLTEGHVLTAADLVVIKNVYKDAEAIEETAKKLYEPFRQK